MRVALLTLDDAIDHDAPARLAGQTIAWHQMRAAVRAGCERILCLASSPGSDLAAIQRGTEELGARFHAISHARALSGLVQAADTLIVFGRGVMPDDEWLQHALGGRTGIAILPADRGTALGFERVDRDRAWGGVLATRGDSVEALAQLPPDADPVAGLLRVALQRGGRAVDVPAEWIDAGRWALLADAASAKRFEPAWYGRRIPPPGRDRPLEAAAYAIARKLAVRSARQEFMPQGFAILGPVLALGGGALGYFGFTVAALTLLAIAIFGGDMGRQLGRFVHAGDWRDRAWLRDISIGIVDLGLLATAASPQENEGWAVPFAALVFIAGIRLSREETVSRWARPLGDRALVLGVIALAAAAGAFGPAMALVALAALAIRLFAADSTG